MTSPSFGARTVLAFESRRAKEIETLIATLDGRPMVAPAMRELPLDSDEPTRAFADAIARNEFDAVVFLTGVGVRALVDAVDRTGRRSALIDGLIRTRVITRGPKPLAALRDLAVPVWVNAPEPNTWRELMAALDARPDWSPAGARVAVQEYGVPNVELLDALRARHAIVTAVPTYQWAMPDDVGPLKAAAAAAADAKVDVLLVTSGIQLVHFWRIVTDLGLENAVRRGLARALIGSIGPSASAELRRHGIEPSFEPSHPKMGLLVREAAAHFTP
jgi:uroporphyrinogen-III synthase